MATSTLRASICSGYHTRVGDTSMEPAYRVGDVVFVDPHLGPAPDSYVLLRRTKRGEKQEMIKLLIRETKTHWHVRQWNPGAGEKAEFAVCKSEWPKADRVAGSYFALAA